MVTKDIRTSMADTACDVCGRTLLRGEHADVFLDGAARRSVCDLCKSRALSEGWLPEGTVPADEGTEVPSARKRSLFARLLRRREPAADVEAPGQPKDEEGVVDHAWVEPPTRAREQPREHRQVRAAPTSGEQKCLAAVELFNSSGHPRIVAGVARSLGPPDVAVLAPQGHSSLVYVVVSWELCWYRYEVDLAHEVPSVRTESQGAELAELSVPERQPNASADESGKLALAE